MQTNSIKNMFKAMGYDIHSMPINKPIVVSGWEVKTIGESGQEEWRNVTKIVRKESAQRMIVKTHNHSLSCSSEHKIFVKHVNSDKGFYEEVVNLVDKTNNYSLLTDKGWMNFQIESKNELIEIVDLEVEGSHSYLSGGILSHNTMYGDPTTTTSGQAIPYAASLRLRLMSGQPIKENDKVRGLTVEVKTIKNKVAMPFRACELSIIFGRGINDDDQVFDILRAYCDVKGAIKTNGKRLLIEGGGSWKNFSVTDDKTGEVLHDIKFYKSEFRNKVLSNPELDEYVNQMLDVVMIMKSEDTDHVTLKGADLTELKRQENND